MGGGMVSDSNDFNGCDNSPVSDEGGDFKNLLRKNGIHDSKGKRLWKKVKYQLVEYHNLHAFLRDNEYIVGYYRAGWPMKQILLSIFTIHNETLNVWTHLLGFFLFLSLTVYTARMVPQVVVESSPFA